MTTPSPWIDEIAERCREQKNRERIARELFQIAIQHSPSVFEQLIAQIRVDVDYFRHVCSEADPLLNIASRPFDFEIWTIPPYNSRVHLSGNGVQITYSKEIQKNPRADPSVCSGVLLIRANISQSVWLEHKGNAMTFQAASRLLVEELFKTVANPEM